MAASDIHFSAPFVLTGMLDLDSTTAESTGFGFNRLRIADSISGQEVYPLIIWGGADYDHRIDRASYGKKSNQACLKLTSCTSTCSCSLLLHDFCLCLMHEGMYM